MVYQLRSLDHLAFDLVKLNASGIQLPLNWRESCFFPLYLKIPKKAQAYNCVDLLVDLAPGLFLRREPAAHAFDLQVGMEPLDELLPREPGPYSAKPGWEAKWP